MRNVLSIVTIITLAVGLSAQADQHAAPIAGVAGTWDVLLMSHQVGLVLEQDPADASKVTGTLMIMGQDVPVDGTFVDGRLTLTGAARIGDHDNGAPVAMRLTATLKGDDTLEGEMATAKEPVKWTAERLKKKP